MNIINNSYKIIYPITERDWEWELKGIETAGRTAYKSQESTEQKMMAFIRRIVDSHHEAVLEFGHIRVEFTLSRYLTHELVRHRHCSFVQESTRYCNYLKKGEITVVRPTGLPESLFKDWENHCLNGEQLYCKAVSHDVKPEYARSFLPADLAATIVVHANMREWRHIFSLRCDKAAHPALRAVMLDLYRECLGHAPAVFEGAYKENEK